MHIFTAELKIIGINPYVEVPQDILESLFAKAGKSKGTIPICGTVNGKSYKQTLVRYAGDWRLYINTSMLKNSPKRISELLEIELEFDHSDRSLPLHPDLHEALKANPAAQRTYSALPPSRQHEINRYICNLKTEAKRAENIEKAIGFLQGEGRFVGRDKP